MTQGYRVAVLGSGSWGAALGLLFARRDCAVTLWVRRAEEAARIRETRRLQRFLPDVPLPDKLAIESELAAVVAQSSELLIVVPSIAFDELLLQLRPLYTGQRILWATKGLEPGTGRLLSELVIERLGANVPHGVLSGPSFAGEVARDLPTAVTIAATPMDFAEEMAGVLSAGNFRVYTSRDLVGVQLGGAVKNVLAIAAGIADGLGFGANARAGLITRGLAELMRLGQALGAEPTTLVGLSGLGDLVLTCTDDQSRNRRLGLALGHGATLADAKTTIGQAVEGVDTARVVMQTAARVGVDMPICRAVHDVLFTDLAPARAVAALFERSLKAEFH